MYVGSMYVGTMYVCIYVCMQAPRAGTMMMSVYGIWFMRSEKFELGR